MGAQKFWESIRMSIVVGIYPNGESRNCRLKHTGGSSMFSFVLFSHLISFINYTLKYEADSNSRTVTVER